MKASIIGLLVLVVGVILITAAAPPAVGQKPAARCHIILLDSSGSMKRRYDNNLKGWLIEPLMNSGSFGPSDYVIVRWFHQRGNTRFDANDPLRKYNGPHNVKAVVDATPGSSQAVGLNTDLPEALELALVDMRELKVPDDALIWMVTDNDQDVNGPTDADGLYRKISGNAEFRAAYLFPLTRENGKTLSQDDTALVMYLLHYSTRSASPNIDSIADAVGKRVGSDPITWIPVEGRINIDESGIVVNSQPAQIVDGKLLLPLAPEGTSPEFNIAFRFRSRLRGREVEQGKITDERAVVTLPASLESSGDAGSWRAMVTPPYLRIKPKQQSSNTYTAVVRAPGLTLQPSSFWDAVWRSESDPVDAALQLTLVDTKPKLDAAELSQVRNLSNIQNIIQQSQNSKRPILVPMTFRVAYNSGWRRVVAALAGVLLVGVLGAVAAVLLIKKEYMLAGRGEERVLALPIIAKTYIPIDGENAAVITRRFSKLTVAPMGLYQVNGGFTPVRLKDDDTFLIHDETGARKYPHEITRRECAPPPSVAPDSFYE
jgi:hypothetical protein